MFKYISCSYCGKIIGKSDYRVDDSGAFFHVECSPSVINPRSALFSPNTINRMQCNGIEKTTRPLMVGVVSGPQVKSINPPTCSADRQIME